MKKIVSIFIICCSMTMAAQQNNPHEFLIGGGFGLSSLKYANSEACLGGSVDLGYAYNFNKHIALSSGISFDLLSTKTKNNSLTTQELIHIPAYAVFGDDRFDYNADIKGFVETQKVQYLSIPLMIRYQTKLKSIGTLYGMGGLKFGIPVNAEFDQKIDQYTTTGYSYLTRQTHKNEEEYGYSTYNDQETKGSLDLGFNIAIALEAGYAWNLGDDCKLYTGVYMDYGLNNIAPDKKAEIITYNPEQITTPEMNSITTSVDKINTMSFGVMIRLSINLSLKSSTKMLKFKKM